MPVPDLLYVLRSHPGGAPALTLLSGLDTTLCWNYAQLLGAAAGFRHALQAGGIGAGGTVCVIAGNSPQFIALFLACFDLGAAFVPLHPDQHAATMAGILRDLQPGLVIVDDEVQGGALRRVLRAAARVWRLRLQRTPWLRPVLASRAHGHATTETAGASCVVDAMGDVPVLVLHSSGSTGAPKVILYSRRRLNTFLYWQSLLFDAFPDLPGNGTPSARVNALPLTHFGGLSFVLQGLLDGRVVHLPRAIAPQDYLRLAVREHCQLLMLVPALYEALLKDSVGALPPSALRYCLTMGEAVTPRLIQLVTRKLGLRVYSAYGMSEGLSGLSHHGADTPPDSCGRLLLGSARLVDDDAQVLDAWEDPGSDQQEGELWVRNPTTFPCYRDPALNAAKFRGGWYRTGDRFRRDTHGHHYFLGRVDAMCVINGRNVYPAEVEGVFLQHPDVADCMAAVMTLAGERKRLGLLVCLQPHGVATPAGLIDWFLERGALYATPAWLMLAKGIPRNAAGKRDRLAVAALLQEEYAQCLRKVS